MHRLSNELARRGHYVEVIHCLDSYRLLAGRPGAGTYDDHPHVTVHGLKQPVWLSLAASHATDGLPLVQAEPPARDSGAAL